MTVGIMQSLTLFSITEKMFNLDFLHVYDIHLDISLLFLPGFEPDDKG